MDVIDGDRPGAFSAIVATGAYSKSWNRIIPAAAFVPLPVAVLVHAEHRLDILPVGIAVPYRSADAIHVDAVLSSRARAAWERVRSGEVGVSVNAANRSEYINPRKARVVDEAVLFAIDLVCYPADSGSRVTAVCRTLSAGQRRTQELFDEWLDRQRPTRPPGEAFAEAANVVGASAMDELGDIVAPLILANRTASGAHLPRRALRSSTPRPLR